MGNYAIFLIRVHKKPEDAELFFEQAILQYPNHAGILTKYANFLKSVIGDIDKAEIHYIKAIEANAKSADAVGSYAVFLHSKNGGEDNDDKALKYYEEAYKLDDTHVNTMSNYGLYLAEVKGNL